MQSSRQERRNYIKMLKKKNPNMTKAELETAKAAMAPGFCLRAVLDWVGPYTCMAKLHGFGKWTILMFAPMSMALNLKLDSVLTRCLIFLLELDTGDSRLTTPMT